MVQIAQLFFAFDRFLGLKPIGNGNINDTFQLDFEAGGAQKAHSIEANLYYWEIRSAHSPN